MLKSIPTLSRLTKNAVNKRRAQHQTVAIGNQFEGRDATKASIAQRAHLPPATRGSLLSFSCRQSRQARGSCRVLRRPALPLRLVVPAQYGMHEAFPARLLECIERGNACAGQDNFKVVVFVVRAWQARQKLLEYLLRRRDTGKQLVKGVNPGSHRFWQRGCHFPLPTVARRIC